MTMTAIKDTALRLPRGGALNHHQRCVANRVNKRRGKKKINKITNIVGHRVPIGDNNNVHNVRVHNTQ